MFWILLIGIIIVYCVLKEEDSSGSSSNKRSSTTTSKAQAAKTLNVPYPYSAIKRMEVPVYIRETGINNKIATDILTKKIIYDENTTRKEINTTQCKLKKAIKNLKKKKTKAKKK